jgi:hypothetical protein
MIALPSMAAQGILGTRWCKQMQPELLRDIGAEAYTTHAVATRIEQR